MLISFIFSGEQGGRGEGKGQQGGGEEVDD